ncbi:MAG: GIY-YIG nuclease family protein [Selenomonadaceae bacterium]|nr:GIY-YIG nuclease family protein [Selenomonadaceae bacterium]
MDDEIMGRSMVVYLITNTVNGKKYVGQTARPLGQRIREHTISEYPIGCAMRKYGRENFTVEILAEGNTIEELCELERFYISTHNTTDPECGYNLTEGGEHIAGWHHTDQARANISAALAGKPFTEEHKEALRQANLGENNPMYGKHLTDEHKAKLSVALSGPNNPLYGVPRSEEVKRKISDTKRANPISEESKAIIRAAASIPVSCDQTGIIYPSITEAAKAIGVTRTAVAYVCHGKTKSVKGFTFRFVDTDKAQMISDRLNENRGLVNNTAVLCIETGVVYPSMIAAAESIGLDPSNISSVCCGHSRTAGGYHWRRLTDDESNIDFTDRRFRAVLCTDTGVVYESVVAAAAAIGINPGGIYSVCDGKSKTANGLHFEYVEPNSKRNINKEALRKLALARGVAVLCVETGEKYETLVDAEKATGINAGTIGAVCLGKRKTAGGYHWRRLDREHVD